MFGFGRTIALRRFIALQQFRVGFETEFAAAAMSAAVYIMQFVLPNRTPLPATHEAGLVQIAESLIETRGHSTCLYCYLFGQTATRCSMVITG